MEELNRLGQYPILQFFGALLVFAVGAYALIRGVFDKRKTDNAPPPAHPEQRLFFDGPLVEALRYLRDGAKAQEQTAREMRSIAEATRETNRILEDINRRIENIPSARRR